MKRWMKRIDAVFKVKRYLANPLFRGLFNSLFFRKQPADQRIVN